MAIKTRETFLAKPVNHLYMLLVSAGVLSFLGLVMVFSASSIHSLDTRGTALTIVLRQIIFLILALPLAAYLAKLSAKQWNAFGKLGFILSIAILMILLIPGVGRTVNGNTNWIDFKYFDVQPSEIA